MLAENLQKFIVSLLYGSLVLQSFIVLVNPMNVNKKANLYFGLFLFFWSGYWILDVLLLCDLQAGEAFKNVIYLLQIFTPILLYFSVIFFINPNYTYKRYNLFCLVIPIIYALFLFNSKENKLYYTVAMFIDVSHNLLYLVILYFKIKHHQSRIQIISSNTDHVNLQWLVKFIILMLITLSITVGYELYNIFIYKKHEHLWMDMLFLGMVYMTSYYSLRQKEIYPIDEHQRKELLAFELEDPAELDKKKLISDEEFEIARQRLLLVMDTEKPYLDGELNLIRLAQLMQMSSHQLSYLINKGFNENFFSFINNYRVQRAKELLLSERNHKLNLLGIAYESGFNSKTSFNTIFKKSTHQTPSEFRKKSSDL